MRRPQRLKSILYCLTFAAVGIFLVYTVRVPLLTAVSHGLDIGEEPAQADVVLMLPGDQLTRPFVTAALVNRGYANMALVPQNLADPDVEDGVRMPTHDVTLQVLRARGVAESQIEILPSATTSTWADAEALDKYLRARPNAKALVVTHHFHTRRSRWVFRQVMGERTNKLHFIAAPTDDWTLDNWWQSKAGLKAVSTEYLKFVFYLFRYGDWRAWTALGAVGALVGLRWVKGRSTRATTGENDTYDKGPPTVA